MNTWPKLSEQLSQGYRCPDTCQSCGRSPSSEKDSEAGFIETWIEHDWHDKPTQTIVLLCPSCSRRLIEPHPRLYARDTGNRPRPGAMAHLCIDCVHRKGLDCTHPDLKANGGTGLNIKVGQPVRGFWDGADSRGRRTGGMFEHWPKAKGCAGRDTAASIAAREMSPE